MVCFLTSSITKPGEDHLNPENGFVDKLHYFWKHPSRCLLVASDPQNHMGNDEMTNSFRAAFEHSGFSIQCFDLWDNRYFDFPKERVQSYDVIIMAWGYVPTQHKWFTEIGLKKKLQGFDGILIGVSAGSMMAAKTVYAWPERDGETLDPNYELFFEGLGYADCMVLPHYHGVKHRWLDGRRLMEDMTCEHSMGHRFLGLPDGSYVLSQYGRDTVFGEAILVQDGVISLYCGNGDERPWNY